MSQMKRRFPWWLLVVAFVAVPIAEIYVIIQVGQVVGPWWTILLLIASGVIGSWLMKREGSRAWRALREALARGRMPARELADGILILVAGTLMLSPGFLSDLVGAFLILPVTRPIARTLLTRVVTRRLIGPAGPAYTAQRPGDNVVPGEVID
ncbi:MAG: FxsA family protein [Myxococcales bacterium]|nr:MAG: FxsA family protein [Myxococcales bacterium]